MCKYCDLRDDGWKIKGKEIAKSGYEECYITLDNYSNEYVIAISGEGASRSHPIECCPFCRRNLKDSEKIFKCQTFLEPYN